MSGCQPTVLPLSFNRMSPISLSYTILASLSHTEDSGAVWEGGREVKPFSRTHHCCLSTHSTQGATLDPLTLPFPHPCSAALSPGLCVCQRCSMESNLASLDTKVRGDKNGQCFWLSSRKLGPCWWVPAWGAPALPADLMPLQQTWSQHLTEIAAEPALACGNGALWENHVS